MTDLSALPRMAGEIRQLLSRTSAFGARVRSETDGILGALERDGSGMSREAQRDAYANAAGRFDDGVEHVKNAVHAMVGYLTQIKSLQDECGYVAVRPGEIPPLADPRAMYDEPIAFTRKAVQSLTDIACGFAESRDRCLEFADKTGAGAETLVTGDKKPAEARDTAEMEDNIVRSCRLRPEDIRVTFDDIVGASSIRLRLENGFLAKARYPNVFVGSNSVPPSGILLYGVPGTGKTMIAKAIASALKNVSFFLVSASDLKNKYVGESEKRVAALFRAAYASEATMGSVIFIDEVDGLLGKRSGSSGGGGGGGASSSVGRGIVNEFIQLWDGFATDAVGAKPVLVIGATNLPHDIDDGALRRFTERIEIPMPDENARFLLFKHYMRFERHLVTDQWITDYVVPTTHRFTPADISNVVRKARANAEMFITGGDATHVRRVKVVVPDRVREPIDYRIFNNPFEDIPHNAVEMFEVCPPSTAGAEEVLDWETFQRDKILPPLITKIDIVNALSTTRPSVSLEMKLAIDRFTESMGNVNY